MESQNEYQESSGSSGAGHPSAHLATTVVAEPIISRVSVPAGGQHPLSGPPPVTSNPIDDVLPPTSGQGVALDAGPATVATVAPAAPFAHAPASAPPFQAPPRTSSDKNLSATPKPLDGFADEFLSNPSYRTEQLGLAPILRPIPLPREDGICRLRTLVARRAWGDVLKMASTMLTASDQSPHAEVYATLVTLPLNATEGADVTTIPLDIRLETVEILVLQCNAWLKLRRYTDLAAEVERWNFLAQNDATAVSPDWLPWGIHVLAGQAQEYTEDAPRATDILYNLRQRIPSTEPAALACLDNALANMFLRRGKWRLALGSLDRIVELIPAATQAEVKSKKFATANTREADMISCLTKAYTCEILSRQGRALLQAGALYEAAQLFESAKILWTEAQVDAPEELEDHESFKLMPCLMEVNEALYYFSKSHYDRAIQSFSKAVDLLRETENFSSAYRSDGWMGSSIAASEAPNVLYSEAINNMAICHLYLCNMKEAVGLLEGLVRQDPTSFLTERVAFNLSTLYELGSDSATGTRKKRVLQMIAKRFFLHDVGPESFRVT